MPNAIAFFPWIAVDGPISVGPVRMLPYERGLAPGDQPNISQANIDAVLAAYAERKDHIVLDATLMEIGDWRLGQEASESIRANLFRAREFIAFSALAKRRLFQGHFNYCNFDTYAFVIQNYAAEDVGGFSFFTRRRDGGATYVWDSEEFAFLKPYHVASNAKMSIDLPLIEALFRADDQDQVPFESIVEFGRANTDSADVPIHTELVMVKSALESLLGIGTGVHEFVGALTTILSCDREHDGPMAKCWSRARPRAARPIEAWAREFCDLRGSAAHGKERGGNRFVWTEHAHLAFTSILFPLVVKWQLSRLGYLCLNERDAIELQWCEAYLMHDPFAPAEKGPMLQSHEHPWNRFYSNEVLGEVMRQNIARIVDEAAKQGSAPSS